MLWVHFSAIVDELNSSGGTEEGKRVRGKCCIFNVHPSPAHLASIITQREPYRKLAPRPFISLNSNICGCKPEAELTDVFM